MVTARRVRPALSFGTRLASLVTWARPALEELPAARLALAVHLGYMLMI
jgi:hypothetical protein